MRFPQVVVFETDGRLAHVLSGLMAEKRWVLRESRQVDACLRNLKTNVPTVLVVALSSDCGTELELLDQVSITCTDVRKVAVCDSGDVPALPGLAWDLGADFVISPPMSLTQLPEIVGRLMPGVGA